MATIYFSSPLMPHNKKVEAVAGKRSTLLGVAQENGIKIPFECQDGSVVPVWSRSPTSMASVSRA